MTTSVLEVFARQALLRGGRWHQNSQRLLIGFALAASLLVAACAYGIEPADPDLIPEARSLLNYLESVYGSKTLTGIAEWGGGPRRVLAATGREPAIWAVGAFAGTQPKFGPAYDRVMRNRIDACRRWWHERGGIVSMDFHWGKPGDPRGTAWVKRSGAFDVGRAISAGTPENRAVMEDLRRTADYLQQLADAKVPVLWRPLHEIEGGWFWWTDLERPENTAALWRLMFDYFVHERDLHNLIWVYSSAQGEGGLDRDTPLEEKMAFRRRFYPGDGYVDIAGIDIYVGLRMFREDPIPWAYQTVRSVAPVKMAAMCECGALPNPDLMAREGTSWLYCLAWYALDQPNPADWMLKTYRHERMLTLEELPPLVPHNVAPSVSIDSPRGGTAVPGSSVELSGIATDRDGNLDGVDIYVVGHTWKNWFARDEETLGKALREATRLGQASTTDDGRWVFRWVDAVGGCWDVVAVARDTSGAQATSNVARLAVGMENLALACPVEASSGQATAPNAVDSDLATIWFAGKPEPQWLTVDLGAEQMIGGVIAAWWNAYARSYRVETSLDGVSWQQVGKILDNRNWHGDADIFRFEPVRGRYVRLHVSQRGTEWGGLWLLDFGVFGSIPRQVE